MSVRGTLLQHGRDNAHWATLFSCHVAGQLFVFGTNSSTPLHLDCYSYSLSAKCWAVEQFSGDAPSPDLFRYAAQASLPLLTTLGVPFLATVRASVPLVDHARQVVFILVGAPSHRLPFSCYALSLCARRWIRVVLTAACDLPTTWTESTTSSASRATFLHFGFCYCPRRRCLFFHDSSCCATFAATLPELSNAHTTTAFDESPLSIVVKPLPTVEESQGCHRLCYSMLLVDDHPGGEASSLLLLGGCHFLSQHRPNPVVAAAAYSLDLHSLRWCRMDFSGASPPQPWRSPYIVAVTPLPGGSGRVLLSGLPAATGGATHMTSQGTQANGTGLMIIDLTLKTITGCALFGATSPKPRLGVKLYSMTGGVNPGGVHPTVLSFGGFLSKPPHQQQQPPSSHTTGGASTASGQWFECHDLFALEVNPAALDVDSVFVPQGIDFRLQRSEITNVLPSFNSVAEHPPLVAPQVEAITARRCIPPPPSTPPPIVDEAGHAHPAGVIESTSLEKQLERGTCGILPDAGPTFLKEGEGEQEEEDHDVSDNVTVEPWKRIDQETSQQLDAISPSRPPPAHSTFVEVPTSSSFQHHQNRSATDCAALLLHVGSSSEDQQRVQQTCGARKEPLPFDDAVPAPLLLSPVVGGMAPLESKRDTVGQGNASSMQLPSTDQAVAVAQTELELLPAAQGKPLVLSLPQPSRKQFSNASKISEDDDERPFFPVAKQALPFVPAATTDELCPPCVVLTILPHSDTENHQANGSHSFHSRSGSSTCVESLLTTSSDIPSRSESMSNAASRSLSQALRGVDALVVDGLRRVFQSLLAPGEAKLSLFALPCVLHELGCWSVVHNASGESVALQGATVFLDTVYDVTFAVLQAQGKPFLSNATLLDESTFCSILLTFCRKAARLDLIEPSRLDAFVATTRSSRVRQWLDVSASSSSVPPVVEWLFSPQSKVAARVSSHRCAIDAWWMKVVVGSTDEALFASVLQILAEAVVALREATGCGPINVSAQDIFDYAAKQRIAECFAAVVLGGSAESSQRPAAVPFTLFHMLEISLRLFWGLPDCQPSPTLQSKEDAIALFCRFAEHLFEAMAGQLASTAAEPQPARAVGQFDAAAATAATIAAATAAVELPTPLTLPTPHSYVQLLQRMCPTGKTTRNSSAKASCEAACHGSSAIESAGSRLLASVDERGSLLRKDCETVSVGATRQPARAVATPEDDAAAIPRMWSSAQDARVVARVACTLLGGTGILGRLVTELAARDRKISCKQNSLLTFTCSQDAFLSVAKQLYPLSLLPIRVLRDIAASSTIRATGSAINANVHVVRTRSTTPSKGRENGSSSQVGSVYALPAFAACTIHVQNHRMNFAPLLLHVMGQLLLDDASQLMDA